MWTPEIETMLTAWKNTAHDYKILYELSATRSEKYNQIFGVPLIILGSLTTSAIFLDFENCEFWPQLIAGSLSFLLTVLTAVGKFLDYDKIQHGFKKASENWEGIELDIEIMLARRRQDRIPSEDFINTIRSARNKLQSMGLSIPPSVFKDYINNVDRYFGSLGINPIIQAEDYRLTPAYESKELDILQRQRQSLGKEKSNIDSSPVLPLRTVSTTDFLKQPTGVVYDDEFTKKMNVMMGKRRSMFQEYKNSH